MAATNPSAVSVFNFHANEIRTIARDGEPWFVASDVAAALGYRDAANATRYLSDNQRGTLIASTPSGDQAMTLINESGLYRLVLRSRKPQAAAFSDWVTGEVLPAIRKTGSYGQQAKPTPKALPNGLTKEQQDSIKALVRARVEACPKDKQAKAAITCWSAIKSKYGCTYKAVPTTEYPEVLSLLARLPLEGELLDPEPAPVEPPALEPLSFARALKALNAPNGVYVDTATLVAFIQAANARLAARCKYYETKCGY